MAKIEDGDLCPCGSARQYRDCHAQFRLSAVSPSPKFKIQCTVVPEPAPNSRSVFVKTDGDTVFFQGVSDEAWLHCGRCDSPLATGVEKASIKDIVMKCRKCEAFNEVPPVR